MIKQNVLLIQPHSDDVLFSASKYIFDRRKYGKMVVLTVEHNEKRLQEDIDLFSQFDIKLRNLETKISSENFHKEYYSINKKIDETTCWEFCMEKIGKKKMLNMISEIEDILQSYLDKEYLIVSCLGVGHPFHWLVNTITKNYTDLFYRDFPHSYKRRNQEYFDEITGMEYTLESEHFSQKEHDEKFNLVSKFYKSQKSLLFFEKRYIDKNLPEQYYERQKTEN